MILGIARYINSSSNSHMMNFHILLVILEDYQSLERFRGNRRGWDDF